MCIAIRIPGRIGTGDKTLGFYEGHPLPVLTRSRTLKWYKWGRIYGSEGSRSWPAGGWVDIDLVRSGKWWRLNPLPVLIPAEAFMAKSVFEGLKHDSWFGLDGNSAIQGALARREGEQRVYIVTQPNEERFVKLWPRLVGYPVALVKWDI